MRTAKMYEVNDVVMIKVKVAGIEIRQGDLLYRLKDPKSDDCLPFLYEDKDIIHCDDTEDVDTKDVLVKNK